MQAQLDIVSQQLESVNEEITTLNKRRQSLSKLQKELEIRLNASRLNALSERSESYSSYDNDHGFPWSEEIHRVRSEVFRLSHFRPLQLRAINATLDGKDLILVMPTGAGKSLVYQLPALLNYRNFKSSDPKLSSFNPITLVISPLVSLMTDQTMSLTRLGLPVGTVTVFDASTPLPDQKRILDQLATTQQKPTGNNIPLRLLFITPEKLAKSKRLLNRLETAYANGRLGRIAIDEVHCVSQWGHDFRPDYQFLHVLRRQFPSVPILGLTATASAEVIVDIQTMLNLKPDRCLVIRSGYNRPNLYYKFIRMDELLQEEQRVQQSIAQRGGLLGIMLHKTVDHKPSVPVPIPPGVKIKAVSN
ncbi:unnamed protein product [Echinostoma caproni]|uniref:DNA 3'-5' helicase n=1 Tax=Echinostoma caproni TaxID=27848 RepID=A0A3P8IPB0_9TREM|nr:unnamed protein product [Echinostoma caproni]